MSESLLDAKLLQGLSKEDRIEALAAAAAAKRAEERAAQRALERALKRREEERKLERDNATASATSTGGSKGPQHPSQLSSRGMSASIRNSNNSSDGGAFGGTVKFISKRERLQQQQQQQALNKSGKGVTRPAARESRQNDSPRAATFTRTTSGANSSNNNNNNNNSNIRNNNNKRKNNHDSSWTQEEVEAVRISYLGLTAEEEEDERAKKRKKQKATKKITFKFKWDEGDDTFHDNDPLYGSLKKTGGNKHVRDALSSMTSTTVDTVRNKPLHKMTPRDWRIFRENYEIVVKGGRAPPPLRSFGESPLPVSELPELHEAILDSLQNVMGFSEPTPIQRQSIPIGLQRRDLIGIAETGSGKTVAFGVPICNYILNLPDRVLNQVADEGPLALVMAPTRELALQINEELVKLLSRQRHIKSCCIIGGQQLQHQANELRQGVHILVGTPGRINECIEMAYLVLNQCSCAVLDEGDRMIDMGFAPQIESVLDAMGAALKSDVEQEAYEQEKQDLNTNGVPKYRVTALFSATMPMEVERMAKKYLRHPAVISIGDKDSGKNSRIVQRVLFLPSPSQKERALRDLLSRSAHRRDDKTIVFVNEKKHADGVGRMVERMGRACVVLHGGKSQDQREENLNQFRRGGVVLVATDVAGRGIDIPNVTHVINFDLPTRSIENYTHRIGRTGRAGKEGLATSFITEEDEGIMAPLKSYLESTGHPVPDRLAKHPAASAGVQGNLIH